MVALKYRSAVPTRKKNWYYKLCYYEIHPMINRMNERMATIGTQAKG